MKALAAGRSPVATIGGFSQHLARSLNRALAAGCVV